MKRKNQPLMSTTTIVGAKTCCGTETEDKNEFKIKLFLKNPKLNMNSNESSQSNSSMDSDAYVNTQTCSPQRSCEQSSEKETFFTPTLPKASSVISQAPHPSA